MRRYYHQRGSIYVVEFTAIFTIMLGLVLSMIDVARYVQYREQLQSAAFAVATVISNREYYYPGTELVAYSNDIDQDGNLDVDIPGRLPEAISEDYQALRSLAAELLPVSAAEIGLVIEQWQESVGSPSNVQRVSVSSTECVSPGLQPDDELATPVYVVAVCDLRPWTWISRGFSGGALEAIAGNNYRGIAVMSSRNSDSIR